MRQQLITTALCLLIVLGALGFAGWTLITGQVHKQGIDALFLLSLCLVIALMFAPIPIMALRRGLLQQFLKSVREGKTKSSEGKDRGIAAPQSQESPDKVKQQSV
jgi:hypothetical protein